MRCPLTSLVTAGIITLLFMGCNGSGVPLARDAGWSSTSTAAASAGGGVPSMGGSSIGGPGASGGETDPGVPGKTASGAGTSATGGTPAGGATGTPSTGGIREGGSQSGTAGGGGSAAGTTASASSASTASATSGGNTTGGAGMSTGSTSHSGGTGTGGAAGGGGGTTAPGGSRSGRPFAGRFVGNIDAEKEVPADFYKYWDQFTPENAGKWPAVQSAGKDTFNWTVLDGMYKYTEDHNIIFKESSFIWGSSSPNWMNNSNIMETAPAWMKAFCERYPKTRLIDVVNEPPPHTSPSYALGLGGGTRTTWDWVANSFKMAREACPNAILILNDYNICEYATDNQNVISLVKAIQVLDAPIDAIGCQAHDAAKIKSSAFKRFMDKITSETGLPVYITEFDVGLADDEQQRAQYADYFTLFADSPNVKGVTLWGYITGKTWRSNTGIMSSEGSMRPAMTWLMDFLGR